VNPRITLGKKSSKRYFEQKQSKKTIWCQRKKNYIRKTNKIWGWEGKARKRLTAETNLVSTEPPNKPTRPTQWVYMEMSLL